MTGEEERERLEAIEHHARGLLASADPLLRSQYAHLLGRVSALLAIVREGAPATPAPAPGAGPPSTRPRAARRAGRRGPSVPGDARAGQA